MITSYSQTRLGDIVTVTVTSDLVGEVFYYWYLDGSYFAATSIASCGFRLEPGEPAVIECVDTLDAEFDAIAGAPLAFPARRTLFWVRSADADVALYRVEMQVDGGEWETAATIAVAAFAWYYTWTSGRLEDGMAYVWRVVPVDTTGNDGTPIVVLTETMVRTPDAPAFAIAWDVETGAVEVSEEV